METDAELLKLDRPEDDVFGTVFVGKKTSGDSLFADIRETFSQAIKMDMAEIDIQMQRLELRLREKYSK